MVHSFYFLVHCKCYVFYIRESVESLGHKHFTWALCFHKITVYTSIKEINCFYPSGSVVFSTYIPLFKRISHWYIPKCRHKHIYFPLWSNTFLRVHRGGGLTCTLSKAWREISEVNIVFRNRFFPSAVIRVRVSSDVNRLSEGHFLCMIKLGRGYISMQRKCINWGVLYIGLVRRDFPLSLFIQHVFSRTLCSRMNHAARGFGFCMYFMLLMQYVCVCVCMGMVGVVGGNDGLAPHPGWTSPCASSFLE